MGLSNYLPRFGNEDTTTDVLYHSIKKLVKSTSSILDFEINSCLKLNTNEEESFWNKWIISNIILSALKEGFYIEKSKLDLAKQNYNYCLNHKEIKSYLGNSYNKFVEQTNLVLNFINKLESKEIDDIVYYFNPNFDL